MGSKTLRGLRIPGEKCPLSEKPRFAPAQGTRANNYPSPLPASVRTAFAAATIVLKLCLLGI